MNYKLVSEYLVREQKDWQSEFADAIAEDKLKIKRTLLPLRALIDELEKNPDDMKSILLKDKNRFSLNSSASLSDIFIQVDKLLGERSHKMDVMHKEILQFIEEAHARFQNQDFPARGKHLDELQHLVREVNALPLAARADYLQTKYDEKSRFSTIRNEVIGVLLEKYKGLEEEYSHTAAKTVNNPLAGSPNRYQFLTEQGPKTQPHDVKENLPQDGRFSPKN